MIVPYVLVYLFCICFHFICSICRDIGYNTVKEIFMLNSLRDQSKDMNSKRVLKLEEYKEKQTDLCVAIAVDWVNTNTVDRNKIAVGENEVCLFFWIILFKNILHVLL